MKYEIEAVHLHAVKAYSSLLPSPHHQMEVSGQPHALAALPPGERLPILSAWIPERKISWPTRNFNFSSSNAYPSHYADHDIPTSL